MYSERNFIRSIKLRIPPVFRLASISLVLLLILSACSSPAAYNLPTAQGNVQTGLDRFIRSYADDYSGKKAVLITNHSGVNRDLVLNIKLLRENGINVTMVLSPEHGLYGYENDYDSRTFYTDVSMNTIVYNLHNLSDKSLGFLLNSADFVMYDIQDMGMRCYTYISNLKWIMDAMNGTGKELIVLDRPNPIGFLGTDGPPLEKNFTTKFISSFPAPFIYNMTMGEAARYYRGECERTVNLRVIKMNNYRRDMLYSETGLPWVPPSPNLPTYGSSIIYTAIVYLEGVNISLGRGTTKPFEYIGAPWIEPVKFCKDLSRLGLHNFMFRPVRFMPTFSVYKNRSCGGAHIFYTGGKFSPTEAAYRIIRYIMNTYPEAKWTSRGSYHTIDALAGTDRMRKCIGENKTYDDFLDEQKPGLRKYARARRKYLLY